MSFPAGGGANEAARNAIAVIRLLTRLIFVWFVKEKGLIPEALFEPDAVGALLKADPRQSPEEGGYYLAVLQNLFFATLNVEMDVERKWAQDRSGMKGDRLIHSLYRHKELFRDPEAVLGLFAQIPFLNRGLFECLDRELTERDFRRNPELQPLAVKEGNGWVLRVDGFSRRKDAQPVVPNKLFFGGEPHADLSDDLGKGATDKPVLGLLDIFSRYKFTVDENTPVEEEVALDPELLGKVFENLLASYNEDTRTTARKLSGSFYTPREVVDYMVDEALIAYFEHALESADAGKAIAKMAKPPSRKVTHEVLDLDAGPGELDLGVATAGPAAASSSDKANQRTEIERRWHSLLSYADQPHDFTPAETNVLIAAIERLKALDPACGSGAFPMGILAKLVHVLRQLDPDNTLWKEQNRAPLVAQLKQAKSIRDPVLRETKVEEAEAALTKFDRDFANSHHADYTRKLYLIEKCLHGVDIQPIAVQIAKLRFFIALIVSQEVDKTKDNWGITALPNLETKIVAADALTPIERPQQMGLRDPAIGEKELDLAEANEHYFAARTVKTKRKWRDRIFELRDELAGLLEEDRFLPKGAARQLVQWNPFDQNAAADFFDPEWMFQITDGFDITIGNPPYVRADRSAEYLTQRRWLEASRQYQTLWEKWDLYIPFIERGYHLLKPGGVTTMIVSDAYCHAKYAQKSQNWFLKNARILRLDFLSQVQIFDAAVRNITYLFQKADGLRHIPLRRLHEEEFGKVRLLPSGPQAELTYRVFFPEDMETEAFACSTILLTDICYISVGMVVHADEKVAHGAFEMDDLVSEQRDATHPKPFVEGKHLDRWLPATHRWLEWGTEGAPTLFRRPTFQGLYDMPEKILVQRSPGPDPKACIDHIGIYFTESTVGLVPWQSLAGVRNRSLQKAARYRDEKQRSDLPRREELEATSRRFSIKYLLGVINSSTARDFLRANRRSNIHLYPDDWKSLPIPDIDEKRQLPVISLVDCILAAKRADPATNLSELEAELDQVVAKLYGISP